MPEHHVLSLGDVAWRLGATLFFVLLNGFFVSAEFALVKVRHARMDELAAQGVRSARIAQRILKNLDRYLSACQLGITVASLILGALGEPAVGTLIVQGAEAAGLQLDPTDPSLRAVSLTVAFTIITVLHMTMGEQAPKIWALYKAEPTMLQISYPLRIFAFVCYPLIALINRISNGLLRIVGLDPSGHGEAPPTHQEIRAMLSMSADAGNISDLERELSDNVLRLQQLQARHVMVPRRQVTYLSVDERAEAALNRTRKTGHSRYPVCAGDLDRVRGVVHVKDVVAAVVDGRDVPLSEVMRTPLFIPETQPLWDVVFELRAGRTEIGVVVDEYGAAAGLIFLEDILEEIVGPLADEFDTVMPGIVALDDGALEVDGGLPLPDVAEQLGLEVDDPMAAATIGGHITSLLGRLPREGDTLEMPGYVVTVLSTPQRRAGRLRFEVVERPDEPERLSEGPRRITTRPPPPRRPAEDDGD